MKVLWYANRYIVTDVRINLFFCEKMTFVSKGMAQKSGKSHICNVNCRKFRDGEQDVLVSLKVLWYASKCIVTDFRIHLFFCEKMTLVSKGMAQKSWKSYICNVICRKFCDGEQHVLVFVKVLWYANKCIVIDVRIHLFFCEKNDFCIKRDGSKIMKNMHLCNVKCRWRYFGMPTKSFLLWKEWLLCQKGMDFLVFLKVLWYANKCIVTDVRIHLFFCEKNDFSIKRDGSKIGKIAHLQCKM